MTRWAVIGLAALTACAGCRSGATPPAGTGARAVARAYFEALAGQDWPRAYALLAAESRERVGAEAFARSAAEYRRGLGFEPAGVHVTACEERGDEAIAHVTLNGKGPHRSRFKDAVAVRRTDGSWAVVLPADFGRRPG